MGVDMTKGELKDLELQDLLKQTSEMTADVAKRQYDEFVTNTSSRIDGVIYRLKNHYNVGKKINNINK